MPATTLVRALVIALAVFALDRASKIWVIGALELPARGVVDVVPPWLRFTMAWNEGINFGLFDFGPAGRWLLVALALAIVAALLVWLRRARGRAAAIGAGAMIGGALGNVWDRVQYGAVADFLNVSCCGITNPFAFNIADTAIFVGVLTLVLFAGAGDRPAADAAGRDDPPQVR